MADTTYNPAFKHVNWIDNEDVVQADGENGFNVRFHALEAEFARLSTVIANINASLVPVSPAITLNFAPSFFPIEGISPWGLKLGSASKAAGQTVAFGWMPVQLPDGAKIQSMTVMGESVGVITSCFVGLTRFSLFSAAQASLLEISLAGAQGSFQITNDPPPANPGVIDNNTNKYVVSAIVGADNDPNAVIDLLTIQILCNRP